MRRLLSTSQWLGLLVMALLIGTVLLFVYLLPPPDTATQRDGSDSTQTAKKSRFHRQKTAYNPHSFDPNTADSITLIENGLPPYVVRSILHYRAKGGRYRQKEDMQRNYLMSDSLYQLIAPWIEIDTMPFVRHRDSIRHLYRLRRDSIRRVDSLRHDSVVRHDTLTHRYPQKKDTILELNSADSASLQMIRGIGPYIARRIIRYREQLGGYVSPEQIREIEGLRMDYPDSVIQHLRACPDSVHPIRVQHASVRQMMNHPYLNFEQARDIYRLRRRHKMRNIEDLKNVPAISEQERERLRPYLDFREQP